MHHRAMGRNRALISATTGTRVCRKAGADFPPACAGRVFIALWPMAARPIGRPRWRSMGWRSAGALPANSMRAGGSPRWMNPAWRQVFPTGKNSMRHGALISSGVSEAGAAAKASASKVICRVSRKTVTSLDGRRAVCTFPLHGASPCPKVVQVQSGMAGNGRTRPCGPAGA